MPFSDISYLGAAGAGLLSFLSPCVLPLVPAYLCFLGGVSLDQLHGQGARLAAGADGSAALRPARARVGYASLAFVLGFSVVFVLLGATASAISEALHEHRVLLARVAGALIVLFGLHFMGILRLGLINREVRFHPHQRPPGLLGAFLIGLAFAFGWTPCIGPVLATILTVAAARDSVIYGASLLSVYALGLGIPFLAAALAAGPFMRWMARFRRHLRKVELVTGGLLVATGVLIFTDDLQVLAIWLLEAFPALAEIG